MLLLGLPLSVDEIDASGRTLRDECARRPGLVEQRGAFDLGAVADEK
jgi:hypothetical protein